MHAHRTPLVTENEAQCLSHTNIHLLSPLGLVASAVQKGHIQGGTLQGNIVSTLKDLLN